MKTRESGMPDEPTWAGFFSPGETLAALGLRAHLGDVVDFGCGYGTFAVPAARTVRGIVHAVDIEPEMVAATRAKADTEGVENLRVHERDVAAHGTGLADAAARYVMLFNILHCEEPSVLLREAWRVLAPAGRLAVMHWNYDPSTPRGPSMSIRPRPAQCLAWATAAGFELVGSERIDLPPHHYGIVLRKATDRVKGGGRDA